MENSKNGSPVSLKANQSQIRTTGNRKTEGAYSALEKGVFTALETYSNVHRGSGHHSMVSTQLFEQAREIILEYLNPERGPYVVIFCTPVSADSLLKQLKTDRYYMVSSQDFGLSIGVRAIVVKKKDLPKFIPSLTGGGTTKLVGQDWVIWADAPDRFEAGTPAIINIIAFARALRLVREFGKNGFLNTEDVSHSVDDILYHDKFENFAGKELLNQLCQSMVGHDKKVPTGEGDVFYINLDNSASTPALKPVWEAFRQTWRQPLPIQQEIVQKVKVICADVLGAPLSEYEVLFTSNTTEAINLAADSLGRSFDQNTEPVILNTMLEHSSNDLPWRTVPGHTLIRLSVDEEGFIDLGKMETLLKAYNQESQYGKKRIRLVALSGASNVLGVCNDLEAISRIVHRYGAKLLVDGAQLVAHRKVDMEATGIDYLAFSAHKVYAPFGCGVLVARKGGLQFSDVEMEQRRTSGEENAAGIAALGKALVLLHRVGLDLISAEEHALTAKALEGLSSIEGLKLFGVQDPDDPRFAQKIGVIVFGVKGVAPSRVAKTLAAQCGIGVRSGCHCAHIIVKRILHISPSLEKFQRVIQTLFPKLRLPGLVRVSFGIQNTPEEIDALIHALEHIVGKKKPTVVKPAEAEKQMNNFAGAVAKRVYGLT